MCIHILKVDKNHLSFSIILLLSEGDEASELQRIWVKSKHVQMQDVSWNYALTKNLYYHDITRDSARKTCTVKCQSDWCLHFSFWVLTYIVSIVFWEGKEKIKARCIVLFICTCHKTQLFFAVNSFFLSQGSVLQLSSDVEGIVIHLQT